VASKPSGAAKPPLSDYDGDGKLTNVTDASVTTDGTAIQFSFTVASTANGAVHHRVRFTPANLQPLDQATSLTLKLVRFSENVEWSSDDASTDRPTWVAVALERANQVYREFILTGTRSWRVINAFLDPEHAAEILDPPRDYDDVPRLHRRGRTYQGPSTAEAPPRSSRFPTDPTVELTNYLKAKK
jgi:hypothetical protein